MGLEVDIDNCAIKRKPLRGKDEQKTIAIKKTRIIPQRGILLIEYNVI